VIAPGLILGVYESQMNDGLIYICLTSAFVTESGGKTLPPIFDGIQDLNPHEPACKERITRMLSRERVFYLDYGKWIRKLTRNKQRKKELPQGKVRDGSCRPLK
jgi:hypothetical protein